MQHAPGGTHGKFQWTTLCLSLNLNRSPLGPWLAASIGDTKSSTLPDFVLWAIDSDNPAIVGIAMLCVAICLQQLDPRVHQYIVRQLPRSTEALFQAYFEKVDRLIVSDVEYSSTEEGIDALMLSAKIYSTCPPFLSQHTLITWLNG